MCEWGNTILMAVNGRQRDMDSCIVPLVKALNDAGLTTIASCCGHNKRPGNIALADGRELIICKDYETARMADCLWPPINS